MSADEGPSSEDLSLTTGGITLLSVLLGIGVTTGFGVSGPWTLRVGVGVATTLVLLVAVKVGSDKGRGPLARLAGWVIGRDAGG